MTVKRRGHVAIELLFVLPILLTILLGTVELSLWLSAQQMVGLAAREATRVAATGGGQADVEAAVRATLGEGRFARSTVTATLNDVNGDPVEPGEPVSVVVRLPVEAVVPDLLAFAGLSIRNLLLVGQTVMRKE
ncbi:MAG: TadE/TadG family type IV pilus assembly protein [Gemmataceae bacterium]